MLALLPVCAQAQVVNQGVGIGPSTRLSIAPTQAPVAPAPPPEHLLGDWGGLQTTLQNKGINFLVDYWAEYAGVVSGGKRTGSDYAGQIGLELDIDWEKLAGIPGFSTHATVVQRNGRNLAGDYLGDSLYNPEQIYGAGGNVVAHLVYLYAEETFLNHRADIVAGRYTVGADFAASPLNCIFMGLNICGNPRILPVTQGYSSWPLTDWGGRIRVRPLPEVYIQTGVFEVSKYDGGRAGFRWGLNDATGIEVPGEVGWEPSFGHQALPGHYKVGGLYDTSDYNDNYLDVNGGAALATGKAPLVRNGRGTVYGLVDQMLVRYGPGMTNGLIGLAGYIHSDPTTSPFSDEAYAGIENKGTLPFRPQDTLGILFTYFQNGKNLTRRETLQNSLFPTPDGQVYVQQHETVVEVAYNIHPLSGVDIAPDFQYIIRPDGSSQLKDAVVLGFNSHVNF